MIGACPVVAIVGGNGGRIDVRREEITTGPNLVSRKLPNESGTTQTAGEGGEKKAEKKERGKRRQKKIVIEI